MREIVGAVIRVRLTEMISGESITKVCDAIDGLTDEQFKAEFDRFADAYYDQHRENVAVTGEGPEYFAEYKIRQLRAIVEREQIGVSRICDFGSGIGKSIPFFR